MKSTIKITIIAALAFSASVASAHYCDTVGKPDVCYAAQVRVSGLMRDYNNQAVRKSSLKATEKKAWFAEDNRFVQWVNTNCRGDSSCLLRNLDAFNNANSYKLKKMGVPR